VVHGWLGGGPKWLSGDLRVARRCFGDGSVVVWGCSVMVWC
jgi:hypothetical protein